MAHTMGCTIVLPKSTMLCFTVILAKILCYLYHCEISCGILLVQVFMTLKTDGKMANKQCHTQFFFFFNSTLIDLAAILKFALWAVKASATFQSSGGNFWRRSQPQTWIFRLPRILEHTNTLWSLLRDWHSLGNSNRKLSQRRVTCFVLQ